jgi:signal transduction histidine kinase
MRYPTVRPVFHQLKWALLLALCCCAQLGRAQGVRLSPNVAKAIHAHTIGYITDHSGRLTLDDVQRLIPDTGRAEAFEALSKLNRNRRVWAIFTLHNTSDTTIAGAFRGPQISQAEFHILSSSGSYTTFATGFHQNPPGFESRWSRFFHRYHLAPGEYITVYTRLHHQARFSWVTEFAPYYALYSELQNDATELETTGKGFIYFNVVFLGLLIFQLIYIAIQWYIVRRVEYAYYILYIACLMVYFGGRFAVFFSDFGLLNFWPASWVERCNDPLLVLPAFFYYRFARHFLNLPTQFPRINPTILRIEYVILAQLAIVLLLNSIIANDLDKNTIIFGTIITQFFITLYAIWLVLRVNTLLSRFVIAASIVAITTHMISVTMPLWFHHSTWIYPPVAVTMMGIIIEVAIFNSGLLFKARDEERDKVAAQQRLLDELKARQKLQEDYNNVRDNIASDLHDDLGSILSSIGIYSYAARTRLDEGNTDETKELLNMIETNAQSSMASMSDLVWAINPNNDPAEKLLMRIKAFCTPLFAAKNIACSWQVDPAFDAVQFTQLERRNLLLIAKETANNIAKHSGATACTMHLFVLRGRVYLRMADNGRGFDNTNAYEGNGQRTMRQRAAEINAEWVIESGAEGTTCTISFTPAATRV